MCTRYVSPEAAAIERHWRIGRGQPLRWPRTEMFPKYTGPFLRAAGPHAAPVIEFALGQWWLIADGAAERLPRAMTSNARWEDLPRRWSFKGPWARGQRCIIPAECFYEPNWESGRHVPWCFRSADGAPWGLAGLWNEWIDPQTGEPHLSYTMLTQNADHHPLMKRMHKPDPKLAAEAQDKRSVVPIAVEDTAVWLFGTQAQAANLVRLAPVEAFEAGPEPAASDPQGSLL
jgi:putative SOS response-associated peptidase YedK